MPDSPLKAQINEAMKAAMRAKEKERLGTIRLILAEIKKVEVDERIDPDDVRVTSILDKMVKQRRDSIKQFTDAGRDELAAKEQSEIEVIQEFLPQPLSAEDIASLIEKAIASTGAASMQDMGKVMGVLKPHMTGRADMSMISGLIKQRLS
ncbi:MAG: GatB/YqeY domain-containing protein [Pseudomonadota bacterium]|nr:GatB/YqeY domain-containing protein [Pseudomonadota bacterium]